MATDSLAINVMNNEKSRRATKNGNNRISKECFATMYDGFSQGLSVRKIAALAGVAKQTVLRHKNGIGVTAPTYSECARKSSRYHRKETQYSSIGEEISKLKVGEWAEIEWPKDEPSTVRLRGALAQRKETQLFRLAFRRQHSGLLRIVRVGTWQSYAFGTAFEYVDCAGPAPLGGVKLPPEEWERRRILLETRRVERKQALFLKNMRRGKQSIWLGQFRQTPQDVEFLALPRRSQCQVIGCAMPKHGDKLCRHHEHFFDYSESMNWRGIEYTDTHVTEGQPIPTFSSMQGWELDHSADRVRFIHHGTAARNEDMGEKWLRENDPAYKPEQPITNIQHTGAFILWKGYGKKKIRKSQRNRPAGWHGNHPEQKPRYKEIERESIAEWAPSGEAKLHVQHLDDELPAEYERYEIAGEDYERDMAIAQIEDNFGFEELQS